jgi:hypothetical protein
MKRKIIVSFIIIGLLVFSSGCIEEEKPEEKPEEQAVFGTTAFYIGDDYADDFKYVNVTFSEIKLHNLSEDANEKWESILSEPREVDLKALHEKNATELLALVEIEVGNYSKLWINVSNATGVLKDTNAPVNFTVPSGWLKIQQLHLINISEGYNNITVYINLNKSIKSFRGGTEYKLTPVISSIEHEHENQVIFIADTEDKIKEIANSPPTIDLLINDSVAEKNMYLEANVNYTFNASETYDADGDTITFLWDFGDDYNSTESVVIHSYDDSKNLYHLILTVSDGEDTSVERINIHIN